MGVDIGVDMVMDMEFVLEEARNRVDASIHIFNEKDELLFLASTMFDQSKEEGAEAGHYRARFTLPKHPLPEGSYRATFRVIENKCSFYLVHVLYHLLFGSLQLLDLFIIVHNFLCSHIGLVLT